MWTIGTTRDYPPEDLGAFRRRKTDTAGFGRNVSEILVSIRRMPITMKQLALVQFFTWLGLFCMWLYFGPAVARSVFGAPDENSARYTEGVEWAGLCFGMYSAVCFVFSFALPWLAARMPTPRHLPRLRAGKAHRQCQKIQPIWHDTGIAFWPQNCAVTGMQPSIDSSQARRHVWTAFLLIVSIGPSARAADVSVPVSDPSRELAFARYTTSHVERDPFNQSGPVGVFIEASLPELYKSAALFAVRKQGEDKRSELHVLQIAGDGTVADEVIERYFALRQEVDILPLSSVAIIPSNYKFHYAGEVRTGGAAAYVYDITLKKNRAGLLLGKIWMDAETGDEVMLSGHLMDLPASGGRVDVVRDTKLMNGSAFARVTHVGFTVPLIGRAEVVITERVLTPEIIPQAQ